jgi:hypothetical protein
MKICDACHASVGDHESSCPSCGLRLETPERAPSPARAEAPPVAPAEPPAPVVPQPAPQQTAECPRHPGTEALGACTRCGTFYCAVCEPDARKGDAHACLACRRLTAPEERRKVLNEFLRASVLLALLLVGFPGILMATLGTTTNAIGALVLGIIAAFFILVVAIALRVTGLPAFAWVLFTIELLIFGGLLLISPSILTGGLLAAICGFTLRSAVKLGALRDLMKAQSASSGGASM